MFGSFFGLFFDVLIASVVVMGLSAAAGWFFGGLFVDEDRS